MVNLKNNETQKLWFMCVGFVTINKRHQVKRQIRKWSLTLREKEWNTGNRIWHTG